jgi:hypothetical protein
MFEAMWTLSVGPRGATGLFAPMPLPPCPPQVQRLHLPNDQAPQEQPIHIVHRDSCGRCSFGDDRPRRRDNSC